MNGLNPPVTSLVGRPQYKKREGRMEAVRGKCEQNTDTTPTEKAS